MTDLETTVVTMNFDVRKDRAALCQLGAAVVLLWNRLTPEMQGALLHRAEYVTGVAYTPGTPAHIMGLVGRNAEQA